MSIILYILGDADKVRERIEAALFAHDLTGLTAFSTKLTDAVSTIVRRMGDQFSATMVMAGGDDVLFTVPNDQFNIVILKEIARDFATETGCTMSFGVGSTPEEAYLNLRRAKAAGGGVVSVGPSR